MIKKYFTKQLKKVAVKILDKEIESYNQELKNLKRMAFGNTNVILPLSVVSGIADMLPSPNEVAMGTFSVNQLLELNHPDHVRKFFYNLGGKEKASEIRIVADDRKDQTEKGLMIEIMDFKIKVFIPLVRADISSPMSGIRVEVRSWVWDFYRAGIRAIADNEFVHITEYISSTSKVY